MLFLCGRNAPTQGNESLSYKRNVTSRSIPFAVIKNVHSFLSSSSLHTRYPQKRLPLCAALSVHLLPIHRRFASSFSEGHFNAATSPFLRPGSPAAPHQQRCITYRSPNISSSPAASAAPRPHPRSLSLLPARDALLPLRPGARHAELGINYNLSTSGSLAFRAQSQFSAGPTVTHAHVCTHTHACTVILLYFPELFFSQLFMREKTALYCAVPFLLPYLLPGALYNCDAFVTAPASYQ